MKRLLFLMLFPVLAFAQPDRVESPLYTYDGVTVSGLAYTAANLDTLNTIGIVGWNEVWLCVQSLDSASIHIKTRLTLDKSNYGVMATVDSLSTNSNTGDIKMIDLVATAKGSPYVQVILDPTAYLLGTTSATYSAWLLYKRY